MARTSSLIAPVQPILHRVPCSDETLTNAPKHYENALKHEFTVQWGGSRAFVAKNSDAISWHELCINCISSAYFASSFMREQNNPKCIQTLQNAPIHEFSVQWDGSGAFIAKNSDAISWNELLH